MKALQREARFWLVLARCYAAKGELVEAKRCIETFNDLKRKMGDYQGQSRMFLWKKDL